MYLAFLSPYGVVFTLYYSILHLISLTLFNYRLSKKPPGYSYLLAEAGTSYSETFCIGL